MDGNYSFPIDFASNVWVSLVSNRLKKQMFHQNYIDLLSLIIIYF